QRYFRILDLIVLDYLHVKDLISREMVVVLFLLLVSSFQTSREKVCGVRADLAAKQIQRITEPEVDVSLNDVERDSAQFAHLALVHQLRGAFDDAVDA